MYVYKCFPACMSMYLEPEKAKRLTETKVTDVCELLYWCCLCTCLVQEETVLLTAELCLQPIK